MQIVDFTLRGEFITLDSLLKATGGAASGAAAKLMVADGRVQVDGRDEFRKTAKIRAGQVVSVPGMRIRVQAPVAGDAPVPGIAPGEGAGS
jgi:ribosome-associated protein